MLWKIEYGVWILKAMKFENQETTNSLQRWFFLNDFFGACTTSSRWCNLVNSSTLRFNDHRWKLRYCHWMRGEDCTCFTCVVINLKVSKSQTQW